MSYKDFILSENGMKIMGFIVTIIVAYITAKFTSKNTKKSLTTQYFKDKGVDLQEKILRFWVDLFMNGFNIVNSYKKAYEINDDISISDINALTRVLEDNYMYCSSKTVKAIKDYMQYTYKSQGKNKTDKFKLKKKLNTSCMFILISRIINRVKCDFTGEKVDELDIIKIKINDLNWSTKFLTRVVLWYYNFKEYFVKICSFIIIGVLAFLFYKIYF